MHRVRGASGDVLARGPGFSPDLSPRAPPSPPVSTPPETPQKSVTRERVWSPRRQREGGWPKARFGSGGSRAPAPPVLRPPSRSSIISAKDEEELQNLDG